MGGVFVEVLLFLNGLEKLGWLFVLKCVFCGVFIVLFFFFLIIVLVGVVLGVLKGLVLVLKGFENCLDMVCLVRLRVVE